MTLDEFRRMTANSPGDLQLVVPISDHCYYLASAQIITALRDKRRTWGEDFGGGESEDKRELVILIS